MYGTISFGGACWLYFALPETKGLSFKEIERQFECPGDSTISKEEAISLHVDCDSIKYGSTATTPAY